LAAKPAGAVTVTVDAPAAPVAGERMVLMLTEAVNDAAPSWPDPVTGLMHVPETHVCPDAQARPHAPQWAVLVWMLTSQPSPAIALQLPKPAAHASPQAPLVQVAVALGPVGHASPQRPQLEVLLVTLTSQPSAAVPLQLPKPVEHAATPHVPERQKAMALGSEHAVPQPPQLEGSSAVLVHAPEQLVRPAPHEAAQALAAQT
jgi:hypothetical protein